MFWLVHIRVHLCKVENFTNTHVLVRVMYTEEKKKRLIQTIGIYC